MNFCHSPLIIISATTNTTNTRFSMSVPHDDFSSTTSGGVDFFGVSSSNGNGTSRLPATISHDDEDTETQDHVATTTYAKSDQHIINTNDHHTESKAAAYYDSPTFPHAEKAENLLPNRVPLLGLSSNNKILLKYADSFDETMRVSKSVSQNIKFAQTATAASAADTSNTSDEREPGETGSLSGVDAFIPHFNPTHHHQEAPRRPPRLRRPVTTPVQLVLNSNSDANAYVARPFIHSNQRISNDVNASSDNNGSRWHANDHERHEENKEASGCQEHIVQLLNEKSGFERQLRTARTEIERLRSQLQQSSGKEAFKQLQQMADQLAHDYNATIGGLNDELERVRCELNRASLAIRKMTSRQIQVAKENQVLKRKLDEKDVELGDTETRINAKTQRVIELELEIEAQKRNQKSFESATRNLKKELESLKEHNRLQSEKIDGLEEDAEQLQDRLRSASERRDHATHERNEVVMRNSAMQAEIEQLKRDLGDLRLHRSAATRLDIETATRELETKLVEIQHECEQLQQDVRTAVVERDSAKRRCDELKNKLDQIERYDAEKTEALNRDRTSLMTRLADAEKQRDALQFESHTLQAKLNAQQQTLQALKDDENRNSAKTREKTAKLVADLERTVKDRLELLDRLEKREAELQSLNVVSKRAAKVHEEELHKLNAQLERQRALYDTNAKQANDAHDVELAQMRSALSAKEAARNKWQQQAVERTEAYERQLRTLQEKFDGEKSRREKMEPQLYAAWKALQTKDFQLNEAVNIFRNMADILRRTPSLEHLVKPIGQLLQQSLSESTKMRTLYDDDEVQKDAHTVRVLSPDKFRNDTATTSPEDES